MLNFTNLTVNRRMKAVIICGGQSEDRQAGSVKRKSLVRICGDIEEIGYIEVITLYPAFRQPRKADTPITNGGEDITKISWPSPQSDRR